MMTALLGPIAAAPREPHAAFGDRDGDGKINAMVTRLNQPALALHNITETANHWLRIRLRGRRSNRDGIGARIRIATNSGEQWNHATTSVGYAGSSEREIHFGLGSSAVVNSIEILWPSGARQELRGVNADRLLDIEEE